MNFIAHLVLSPKEKNYLAGNMAADFLRGFGQKHLSEPIRTGVAMHQFVDRYTDTHSVVKKSKGRIKKHFHLLSGVLVDVFYDHFLAGHFDQIANISLEEFSTAVYGILEQKRTELPPRLQRFLPVMIRENVLCSYREMEGIQLALSRINRMIKIKISTELALAVLKHHYQSLERDFMVFFPCLISATEKYRASYDSFLLPEVFNYQDHEVSHG